ncbi:MAG: hypothetical protein KF729_14570 [Sandaracinaceae bacterium]|nr:hypothetical protein [Sandaracinaceae bacterium]
MTRSHFGKLIKILAAWSVLALIVACNLDLGDTASSDPVPVPSEPVAEPVAEPSGGGGGGSCSRIAACCRAYIDAMGGTVPTSTCDAYNNVVGMQDSLCDQTMAGYRAGLQAMNKTVPADCN